MTTLNSILAAGIIAVVFPISMLNNYGTGSNSTEKNTQVIALQQEPVYDVAEVAPQYVGGQEAMAKFISENIKYPAEAKSKNVQGKVYVKFIVGSDGSVSKAEVIKGSNPLLDTEAKRVIEMMPKWIPGTIKGKAVAVYAIIPIQFKLDDKK